MGSNFGQRTPGACQCGSDKSDILLGHCCLSGALEQSTAFSSLQIDCLATCRKQGRELGKITMTIVQINVTKESLP